MTVSNFRQLRIWQATMNLAERAYGLSQEFPRHEIFGLAAHLQRSAVSVPSNIAEGHTRASRRDFLRDLSFAEASLAEVETQVELAARLRYVSSRELQAFLGQSRSLGRQVHATKKALTRLETDPSAVRRPPSARPSQSPTSPR
jgi:four helix bundle protein